MAYFFTDFGFLNVQAVGVKRPKTSSMKDFGENPKFFTSAPMIPRTATAIKQRGTIDKHEWGKGICFHDVDVVD